MQPRFQDEGQNVWSFASEILVRCPKCGERASVRQRASEGSTRSRLACAACGLSQATPMSTSPWRCRRCGHWFDSAVWSAFGKGTRTVDPCPVCHEYREASEVRWRDMGKPVDPFFGLPLFLQAPCCGNVLWAWNLEHLDLLTTIVGAALRERDRASTVTSNDTLLGKLPRWVKAAKNREAVLACAGRLRDSMTKAKSARRMRRTPHVKG